MCFLCPCYLFYFFSIFLGVLLPFIELKNKTSPTITHQKKDLFFMTSLFLTHTIAFPPPPHKFLTTQGFIFQFSNVELLAIIPNKT